MLNQEHFTSPYINRFLQPDTLIPGVDSPQSWNRFSYVSNNPVRFNDPTGHMQESDDYTESDGLCNQGDTSCSWVQQNIDKKLKEKKAKKKDSGTCGHQGVYSPKCPGWHEYTTTNVVCPAEFQCTSDEMKDYLSRFAFPGQDPSNPVVGQRQDAVTDPWFRLLPKAIGLITTSVSPDGLTASNITRPGHILHDGRIDRTISQMPNGAWIVTTHGTGNNISAVFDAQRPDLPPTPILNFSLANIWGGIAIFDQVDRQMQDYIAANH